MTNETNDSPTCPVCERGFVEGDALVRHAESEHDVLGEFLDT